MTEQDLINMGFQQEPTDDGDYYYSFGIGGLTLITNECKSETPNDVWSIDVFDNSTFQFTNASDVMELKITWDGGGDSGWCEFLIDGETVENEYTERLLNYMYDELDYGSWAGEFQASGSAIYSVEEKAFEGVDEYSEDETISWEVNAEIRIPKWVWFDQFHFSIDGYDEPTAQFDFFIKNGFRSPDHDKVIEDLNSKMNEVIDDAIEDFQKVHSFRSIYENEAIDRSEFVEDGNDIVYKVTHLDMGTTDSSEKDIYLSIKDINEPINSEE